MILLSNMKLRRSNMETNAVNKMVDEINDDWEYIKNKLSKRTDFGKDAEIWFLLEKALYYIEKVTSVI